MSRLVRNKRPHACDGISDGAHTGACLRENASVSGFSFFDAAIADASSKGPPKVSSRTLRAAIEQVLIDTYTRRDLETVLGEELQLPWTESDLQPGDSETKRDVIRAYTEGWDLPRLVALARTIVADLGLNDVMVGGLAALIAEYDRGGGVDTPAKNLIFAANGPKPELVLRDAVNNDIEIVRNGEYCLVYDRAIPADGLTFNNLIEWWRERQGIAEAVSARDVGLDLHGRLRASLGDNRAELLVFDAYAARYKQDFGLAALIPQVYLHFDPATQLARRAAGQSGSPLARQRMDFLILFSSRHRVVIEVDGKQHYARDEIASPTLYSEMVAEDRRLKLAGYEVYRFGGAELMRDDAEGMLADFFDRLADRMR